MPELLRTDETCFAVAPARGGVIVDADDYYREAADAIESAKSYVLLTGWQLESGACMRRRPEDEGRPRTLREVIRAACKRNPDLRIYVLAWDWASVYALDREWGTRDKLKHAGKGQLEFIYDSNHPPRGCHHDKLLVVDGHTAWVGGIDLCEHRWDQRSHVDGNRLRRELHGAIYLPYHDMQAVVRGKVVRDLVEHFVQRWIAADGEPLVLEPEPEPEEAPFCHVSLGNALVGVARTRGATLEPMREPVREVRALYTEALRSAERLVYIESQYMTSRAMVDALADRMRDRSRGPLEIVVLLPACLEGRMEQMAIESPQRVALSVIARIAAANGHGFGAFSPLAPRREEPSGKSKRERTCPTYIHSKMMIVDDRVLVIGSANATNRSMGLDSELVLAWQAETEHDDVARGIHALRVSLLAEHTRVSPDHAMRDLSEIPGLVAHLRALTTLEVPPLLPMELEREAEQGPIDELLASLGDPESAALSEGLFEEILDRPQGILAKVVTALHDVAGHRG
ncbi:MAG: phospholipase D-like domain-containing protein [Myxococcota bacterium]|nr:phospholipase D-like domain-containing protein [Myxococcota bacterium]